MNKTLIFYFFFFLFISALYLVTVTTFIYTIEQEKYIDNNNIHGLCSGFRVNNIYGFTKERKSNITTNINLSVYDDYILFANGGINTYGLMYVSTSINTFNDTNICNYTSNFSIEYVLSYCKNIYDVLFYLEHNPVYSNANILFCDTLGNNLVIQSLCNDTMIIINNDPFIFVGNYPYVYSDVFKPRNCNIFELSLKRKYYINSCLDCGLDCVLCRLESNLYSFDGNNQAGYYSLGALVYVDGDIYIYDGNPLYTDYKIYEL